MPAKENQNKEIIRAVMLQQKRQKAINKELFRRRVYGVETFLQLLADTRVSGKRPCSFQVLNYGAEINRLRVKRFVLCDLGPIQDLEPVALEHFLSAPALECDDLAVNTFFARTI